MITSECTSEFEKEFGSFIEEIGKHLENLSFFLIILISDKFINKNYIFVILVSG